MSDERKRLKELKARANGLGWELEDKNMNHPWGYVLRPFDEAIVNVCTNSATRLDPADRKNPLSGMDSVSRMLDQIEFAQKNDLTGHRMRENDPPRYL